jgi:hypothetical protein
MVQGIVSSGVAGWLVDLVWLQRCYRRKQEK